MTAFVESCVETATGSAVAVERGSRHHARAGRLIRVLQGKKNILITTHQHPDPDALASSFALCRLLQLKLGKEVKVSVSVKGPIGGGYNAVFLQQCEIRPVPWDEAALSDFDAIVLLDVQPMFKLSPLPADIEPTAVIDHHRSRGRRPRWAFTDIRTEVGASSSIIFSYFMELDVPITPELATVLLFAIETDLAGVAGQPGDLDNVALSSLTLLSDWRKLYRMRYSQLAQSIYIAHAKALNNATIYDSAMITHLDTVESPEAPAVIADFLLRYEAVQWVLVTAVSGESLALSLRMDRANRSAADVMRRLVRHIGEGGGHRAKAGGLISLENGSDAEVDRHRKTLRRRLLRALKIRMSRGQKLIPRDAAIRT